MSLSSATQPVRIRERITSERDTSGTALLVGGLVWALAVAATALTAISLPQAASPGWQVGIAAVLWILVALALVSGYPLVQGLQARTRAAAAKRAGDDTGARAARHRARQSGWIAAGFALPILLLTVFAQFLAANDHAVQTTFFDVPFMLQSLKDIAIGFWQNVQIAVLAEILVLVWAMVIALARILPGRAGRPIRWLATAYIDAFRAVPSIIVIYLVGFGLPLAGIPFFSELGPFWSSVLALTLTYGAYVAEVYRSGIDSIHWSQVAAARSLGLSYGKTMRFVVVPQAVRRVLPPLLNDFIGLQKDTALVTIIGMVDAFTQAKILSSNYFNLSSVTVVAILFIIITIPQTRFVDRLIERDNRAKTRG
ncbi:amino acid ABC transporter permease [Leucobacter sp. wl10]|uniref:amino acid ABC transporter permease n=1 Tax=Leucobacter sp. wl10 TaxID=2304677 RepID=UPI000E5B8F12|nr:amino acid ABC transporter permease [Leucobacter sp. wl10]RGE21015.1 amino acid ABC transporter permease [Leucobacter sp. wl10]